jgi:hypothetical protein
VIGKSGIHPENFLEKTILAARAGNVDGRTLAESIWQSPLIIPSRVPARSIEEVSPLTFDKNGTPMLAVFTDQTRVGQLAEIGRYFIVLTGQQLYTRMAPGRGIVFNPRTVELGVEVSPDGVAEAVQAFA